MDTGFHRTISLVEPRLAGNEARYLQECVETNFVSSVGPFVARFEAAIAECAGGGECVSTSSGTTGLHLALTAIGVGRDDLVIVPTYTFIASCNAISHCGATPWLFDISPESWTLDAGLVRATLAAETERGPHGAVHKASGRRVAAILPVYTLGCPAHMDELEEIAREFDVPLVADAAAALGATYKRRPLTRMGAKLSVLSFNGNKTVTTGGGGAIIGSDARLLGRVRHLAATARAGREYDHDDVGFNYRLSNLSAAVGLAQMERFAELATAKQRIRRTYDHAFCDLSDVSCFPAPAWAQHACWLSGILVRARMDRLMSELERAKIETRPFWKPMHLQAPYRGAPRTETKVADSVWQQVVILPSSSGLHEDDQARVIAAVQRVFA